MTGYPDGTDDPSLNRKKSGRVTACPARHAEVDRRRNEVECMRAGNHLTLRDTNFTNAHESGYKISKPDS